MYYQSNTFTSHDMVQRYVTLQENDEHVKPRYNQKTMSMSNLDITSTHEFTVYNDILWFPEPH